MKSIQRILSLILAVLLLLSVFPLALAEEIDEKTRSADRTRIQIAISAVAGIAGNALDLSETTEDNTLHAQLKAFSEVNYMHPVKAVIVQLTSSQANGPIKALKQNAWPDVAPALADQINRQFSETYAQAASLAQSEGKTSNEAKNVYSLVILPYGDHIAVVAIGGQDTIRCRAAFIISSKEISQNLDEAEIRKYCRQFGAEDAAVRVYEEDALKQDNWIRKSSWSTGALTSVLTASEKRVQIMLPVLAGDDSPYMNRNDKCRVFIDSLRPQTVRFIAETCLPAILEGTDDPTGFFLQQSNEAYVRSAPAPEIKYGEELHETALKPDGTYLVVLTREIPEKEPDAWYDVILEAALPVARIPESADAADYIVRCHTTYDGGKKNGKAYLHYPVTRITVHDAHTGEMLRDLGSVKRTLKGVIMLSPGDTWWSPLRTMLWEKISPLLAGENK